MQSPPLPQSVPGLYTRLCSAAIFPLHEFVKGHHSVALRRELELSQWQDSAQFESEVRQRLRDFLVRVGRAVPYYRDMFRRLGIDTSAEDARATLQSLPTLTKALIREAGDSLRSVEARRLVNYNTGGSTGEPLRFSMGPERIDHDVAAKWRATRWWGVDIGDPEVVLWGSPVELTKQDRLKSMRDRVLRTHLLPAFAMSEPQMDEYIQRLLRIRPKMLFGYASAWALLAQHAEGRGVDLSGLGARVAFVTGERLYPQQRELIERVFHAPVANGYGSRDAGFIAHECPAGSLHLSAEHVIVELLDDDGQPVAPGGEGEIVVTHLATADFPFIRYRTGDMGVAGEGQCVCGRTLPVLKDVIGRSSDFIRLPDGRMMHALALIYEVRDVPGVVQFKITQAEDMSVDVQLVLGPTAASDAEEVVHRGIGRRLGGIVGVSVRQVNAIPPEKSGKYRYVVSHATGGRRRHA